MTSHEPHLRRQPGLRRAFLLTPVTGLGFFTSRAGGLYLLVGEDTELRVYDVESARLCCSFRVFRSQSIHGIRVGATGGGKVLVWGGPSVAVFPVDLIEERLEAGEFGLKVPAITEIKAPDWIYDGAISLDDPSLCVLATAHNEALEATLSDVVTFGRIVSPSRPNLYSANLTWIAKDTVLVAGGTVFGEILVWTCRFAADGSTSHEVLSVLAGHEGSIFGVDISPEIDVGGGRTMRLLASCSDDRTIRIWDITKRSDEKHSLGEARETGFGGGADQSTTANTSAQPLAVAMGHMSRIWHVKFPRNVDTLAAGSPLPIYSYGEDATTQTWHLDLGIGQKEKLSAGVPVGAMKLTHQATHSHHDGKHIWSTAMTRRASGDLLIATGGADGKVNLLAASAESSGAGLTPGLHALPNELRTFVLQDVLQRLPPSNSETLVPSKIREVFQRYDFISPDTLLASSNTGRLFVGPSQSDLGWAEIALADQVPADFRSCTVIKSPAPGIALIGTASGRLYLYRDAKVEQIAALPGKVADLFCLQPTDANDGARKFPSVLDVLVTSIANSEGPWLLTLDLQSGAVVATIAVPAMDERAVVTSAAIIGDSLIVGTRSGFFTAFTRRQETIEPLATCERRTRDAITAIIPLPGQSSGTSTYVLTTCRDGKYRVYEIDRRDGAQMHLRHETAPPALPNLEGAWFAANGDGSWDLILYGFRSKNFIAWNETKRQEIMSVDCGGAHRNFTYITDPSNAEWLRFAYTKASALHVFFQTHSCQRILKQGMHGREMPAVAHSGKYVATGAEDTTIRIWEYDGSAGGVSPQLRPLAVMTAHTAGLHRLKWFRHDHLFSSAGNEEFMVWRVQRLDASFPGLAVMCEAVFGDKSADGDLRIMDFDVSALEREDSEDPILCITMVFSNSAIKTYRYEREAGFRLLARGHYTGACLTQIRHLGVEDGVLCIMTASTDGHLAIWSANALQSGGQDSGVVDYTLDLLTTLHQSSIKALDVRITKDDIGESHYLIITGGDDNAIAVTSVRRDTEFTVVAKVAVRRAHAAAINGTAILESSSEGALLATASNDQRVKLWKVERPSGRDVMVSLVANEYSGVADAGDLEVVPGSGQVIVGGVGLEVWDFGTQARILGE